MSRQNDIQKAEENEDNENRKCYEAEPSLEFVEDASHHVTRNLTIDDGESASVSNVTHEKAVSSDFLTSTSSEAVKPCGRINSCMVVSRDALYIYGGMMEVRDREITLDDLYMLNLSKLDEWKCIIPASESEWLDISEDDDEDDTEDEQSDTGSDGAETDEEDDGETRDDGERALAMGDAVAIIRGEGKNLRRKEKRVRIEQIRANLGLSDSQRTPMPGESLKDFYKRTNMYWQMAAHEHTQHTGKELRKDGFDLAEARFREPKPVLDELAVLEAEQKAEEAEAAETSSRKRGNKKNKHQSSQR
eukprot:TRINITY_DN825_c1_g1_i5.p1 TRINITY_DN825_c1_g1~~TRINITY_DN825_c1_g1_i5.p1  ORF type:complete len:304 (-),score=99.07 TRINITY_DN825_c1_g1_i5:397-1308(-)